ncbi:MAG: GNAT family N-acetyltransferase [Flavobacterium sp.]|nr:GNAT family N-acetyltransferase [Flavobacterium sp.]
MIMIKEITTFETFTVRHPVLRAGQEIETCYLIGDDLETTVHFGYYFDDELAGVVTLFRQQSDLFPELEVYRIRGMAVLEKFQKKGFGEKLIHYCERFVQNQNVKLLWFNARINAVGFYEKLNYIKVGNVFEIENLGLHFVMFKQLVN